MTAVSHDRPGQMPAASLGEYSDETLAHWYGILEAEMERRDAEQAAKPDPRQVQRGEWERMAHAQWLDAERSCRGELLNARGMAAGIDPWSLWSGPAHRTEIYASEELRGYWRDVSPRIDITTYQRQASGERRAWLDRHDREAVSSDQMGPDDTGSVRHAGAESAAVAVPGAGPVRDRGSRGPADRPGGRVSDTTTGRLSDEMARRAARIRALPGSGSAEPGGDETAGVIVPPAANGPSAGAVALRNAGTVIQARPVIDGDQTLRYIYTFLKHFAWWASEAEIVAATLWIAMTHARDDKGYPIWLYCARLAIVGASGSGKSAKSRLVGKLSYKGDILVEPTAPAFIDLCAENHTVIMTEADEAFRSPGRSRKILAVANASYEPDRSSSRKQGGVAVKVPLFCHLVLDGIDDVLLSPNRPDLRAMMSRCLIMVATRAPDGWRPPRFDGRARATAEMISQRATAWMAQEVAAGMAADVPQVPGHLGNRPFALWEPLFTVALRADKGDPEGPWSQACREACEQLEQALGVPDQTEDQASELDRQMAAYGLGEDEF